jgi:hypothetical protein
MIFCLPVREIIVCHTQYLWRIYGLFVLFITQIQILIVLRSEN